MTTGTETVAFQAETKELLHLVIHSLYTNKEIFLRELVSNASDALDKRRLEILRDSSYSDDWDPEVRLEADEEARTLRVIDNGIGMTREELTENLGTIARSGTRHFFDTLREAQEAGGELPELIGQFGVGFYSSFMVADDVHVVTRKLGETDATRWSSKGDGSYTLEEATRSEAGTTVELVLKPVDPESGQKDWTRDFVLRDVVKRYSDFISHPIRMELKKEDDETELTTLNSMSPLWTRPKGEIEEDEYSAFYKQLAHDWNDPLETIHFKAEGATEYAALLFLPKERPLALFDPKAAKSRVSLYVRRVFITDDCEELVPVWLRFVPGVVDASDLPLNVSRETLQHTRQMGAIKKRLTRKVLDTLTSLLEKRREDYAGFWEAFGQVLKEGLYYDEENRDELSKLCLFAGTAGEERTTLPEYVERMPVKQKEIYVLLAKDNESAARSPHLETLRAKGFEVLFLVDPVDEFVLQRLTEFDGKTIRQIDKGEVDLDEEGEKEEREAKEKEFADVLEAVRKELAEHVEAVRFSSRLSESPACLVSGENHISPQLERMMRESGQPVPDQKRVLELNASHPLVDRLHELHKDEGSFARFTEWCELLHGQALVAEGSPLQDPARFTELLSGLMLGKPAS